MSVFNEATMIAAIKRLLPAGQHFKAGIHAIVKKAKLRRVFSHAAYDSSSHHILPQPEVSMSYMIKGKEATFDAYVGFSEDYLVIVPCEKVKWYYKSAEITDSELRENLMPLAVEVAAPLSAADIMPVYRISQMDKCDIKKNWVGAYVCKMEFDNGDTLKVLLPPLAGLFGGMPNHKAYRNAILELLREKQPENK